MKKLYARLGDGSIVDGKEHTDTNRWEYAWYCQPGAFCYVPAGVVCPCALTSDRHDPGDEDRK